MRQQPSLLLALLPLLYLVTLSPPLPTVLTLFAIPCLLLIDEQDVGGPVYPWFTAVLVLASIAAALSLLAPGTALALAYMTTAGVYWAVLSYSYARFAQQAFTADQVSKEILGYGMAVVFTGTPVGIILIAAGHGSSSWMTATGLGLLAASFLTVRLVQRQS